MKQETITIKKSDLNEINRALQYAMGYLKADGERYKRRFKKDSVSLEIAKGFAEVYERINQKL